MVTAVVNSAGIASGGTFTAGSGSNRQLMLMFGFRKDSGTPTVTTVTFGGVAMTQEFDSGWINSGDDRMYTYSMPEASIPSGSQTLVISHAAGVLLVNPYGCFWTISGAKQSSPVEDTDFVRVTGTNTVTSASFVNTTGACLLAAIRNAASDSFGTIPSGFTEDQSYSGSGRTSFESYADKAAATATYTWVGADPTEIYLMMLSVAQAAAGGNVNLLTGKLGGLFAGKL